jgi:DNA-binding transcriptional LysR family regulator
LSEPLPFDLRALEIFLAVCETGAMAAAARRLGLTQPAVSQAIADLELRNRVLLFDRAVRPLALTATGWLLRQRASALMTDALQIAPMLYDARTGKLPLLRLGLIASLSRSLTSTLTRFLLDRVAYNTLQIGATTSHANALMARHLDMFLGVDDDGDIAGLERWPLLDEPYLVLWPNKYAPAEGTPRLEQLAAEAPLIRFNAGSKTGMQIDAYLRTLGLEIPRRQEFDTPYAIAASVASGLGWAIMTPLCVVEAGLDLSMMQLSPLPAPGLRRRLALVARSEEFGHLPREIAALAADALRERCQAFIERHCRWAGDPLAVGAAAD